MRGRDHYAVAARRPNGEHRRAAPTCCARASTPHGVWRRPFLRGVAGLYETHPPRHARAAVVGDRAARPGRGDRRGRHPRRDDRVAASSRSRCSSALPLLLGGLLHRGASQSIGAVLIEGVIRAAILVGYLLLIGLIPQRAPALSVSRRRAHGDQLRSRPAMPIDVEHVRGRSRLHPRCGTGFLVVVALVSVGVFAPLGLLPTAVRLALPDRARPGGGRGLVRDHPRRSSGCAHTLPGRIALAPVLATAAAQHATPGRSRRSRWPSRRSTRRAPATASSSRRPEPR